jgi:hypothetical protein
LSLFPSEFYKKKKYIKQEEGGWPCKNSQREKSERRLLQRQPRLCGE